MTRAGIRVLIAGESTLDICSDRLAQLKQQYPGKIEVIGLTILDDRYGYHCEMGECIRLED